MPTDPSSEVAPPPTLAAALAADARNRAARTFLQGLVIDIGVAIATLILASAQTITDKSGLIALGIALGKTVVTTAISYVMRRFLDNSRVPTPTPPAPVPAA